MLDRSVLKLNGIKGMFALLFVMAFVQSSMIILQAVYLAKTITNLFNGEKLENQLLPILLFVIFFIVKQMVVLLRDKIMTHFSMKAGTNLRQQLNTKLFSLGPNITATKGTGNMITMALEGITQVETYIKLFFPKVMNMLIIPVVIFIFTFTLDVRSAVILILVLPTLLFFLILLGIAARKRADKQYETYQVLSNHFVDSLRGLETLRYLGLSKNYDRNIGQVSERYRKSTMGTLVIAFLSSFALKFFTSLSVAIIALFLGLGLIGGEMVLFPALVILILAPEYFAPIREFGSDYHATLDGKNALKAISDILALPNAKRDEEKVGDWTSQSTLTISNLTIRHEDSSTPSLDGVTFACKGFGKIGIVGGSGSGKSTLINVLSGFLQQNSGGIVVNGKKLSTLNNESWQMQILYIPQKPYIFYDTVGKNISFYTPNATYGDIQHAASLAGLTNMIETFDNGFDEIIGESGRMISGGQEQRIALSRAFLDKNRSILFFDEPTAHLDIETEYELKQSMLQLFENRLVFFATHRLHWMMEMDQILVLDDGKLVESGTHDELLAKSGAYFDFVQAQLNGLEV